MGESFQIFPSRACARARKPKVPLEAVENALRASKGFVAHAATALGISRQALNERIRNHPHLKEIVADERERLLDAAEAKLFAEAMKGNVKALIFILRCLGKSRGWVEHPQTSRVGASHEPVPCPVVSMTPAQESEVCSAWDRIRERALRERAAWRQAAGEP